MRRVIQGFLLGNENKTENRKLNIFYFKPKWFGKQQPQGRLWVCMCVDKERENPVGMSGNLISVICFDCQV